MKEAVGVSWVAILEIGRVCRSLDGDYTTADGKFNEWMDWRWRLFVEKKTLVFLASACVHAGRD